MSISPTTLADVQAGMRMHTRRPLPIVAEDIRRLAEQLVLITSVEETSQAKNLVSAEVLSEMLLQICHYASARSWNVDRLVVRASALSKSQPLLSAGS